MEIFESSERGKPAKQSARRKTLPDFTGHRKFHRPLPLIFALVVLAFVLPANHLQAALGSEVVAWGAGEIYDPSDLNDFDQSIVPGNLTNATQVAGGWRHSLALKADGTIQGWGDNTYGQYNFPIVSNGYKAIACGSLHSLALEPNGMVVGEGYDAYGQIDVPQNLSNVVAIACGFYHSLALKSDGTVVAWGSTAGSVGTNPNYGQSIVPSGLSNVVAIAGGGYHSLALKSDGTLVEWGDQNSWGGQIPGGLSNVVAIATGAQHNVALLPSGLLAVWGENTYGQTNTPSSLSNVVAIAAGGWHTLALKRNGTVIAWGAGIGTNTYVDYYQNVVPDGLSNVVQVAAGQVHSLALTGKGVPVSSAPLSVIGLGTNGFNVSLATFNGRVYQLEYADSPTNSTWTALPLEAGTGGVLEFNDSGAQTTNGRFYRALRW